MSKTLRTFLLICVLTIFSLWTALPNVLPNGFEVPKLNFSLFGRPISNDLQLKKGLDLQGGMQVVLRADMNDIAEADRDIALESAREIISRRVDLFGISEPVIQVAKNNDEYRLIIELPGVTNPEEALRLVGTTALLEFRLQIDLEQPENSAEPVFLTGKLGFQSTELTGKQLKRASVQFDPQTGEPVISLEFDPEGTELFAALTTDHQGEVLAIFIDGAPVALPTIQTAILNGQAVMSGSFTLEGAKQLAIQLNAGALPVPIEILEQRTIGASLGEESIQKSMFAGMVGLGLVVIFMILYYGFKGVVASLALAVYASLTVAVYKILGVTLTLPGIAGLLLSIGMAVDANILIFERMKEELRSGHTVKAAMELGFGRAWDSIKDANLATITTALVLINPFNFSFLNRSGLVRGFGMTLLIGVLLSLFTGVVVSRNFMRMTLPILEKIEGRGVARKKIKIRKGKTK